MDPEEAARYKRTLEEIECYLIDCPMPDDCRGIVEHVGTLARRALNWSKLPAGYLKRGLQ